MVGLHRRTSSAALHSYSSVPEGDQDISLFQTTRSHASTSAANSSASSRTTNRNSLHSVAVTVPPEMLDELEEKEGLLSSTPLHGNPQGRRGQGRATRKRSKCKVLFVLVTLCSASVLTYALVTGWIEKKDVERVWGDWKQWTAQQQANWQSSLLDVEEGGNSTSADSVAALINSKAKGSYKDAMSSADITSTTAVRPLSTLTSKPSKLVGSSNVTSGSFSTLQMDRLNERVDDGTLSEYRWHDSLARPNASISIHKNKNAGRLIVVGDLHGTHRSLFRLLRRIAFSPSHDTLIHTGDVLSKSTLENSLATVRLLRKLGAKGVRGNHDQKVVEWRNWMESLGPLDQTKTPSQEDEKEEGRERPAQRVHEAIGQVGKANARVGSAASGRDRQQAAEQDDDDDEVLNEGNVRLMKPRHVKRDWLSWLGAGGASDEAEVEDEDVETPRIADEEETESSEETSTASTVESTATGKAQTGAYRRPFGQRPTAGARSSTTTDSSLHARPTALSSSSSLRPSKHAQTSTALVGPLYSHLDPTLSRSQLAALGIVVPQGWEWGSQHFEIARHLTTEDFDYLQGLPLTLWVDELNSFVVHAGLVPWSESPSSALSTDSSELPQTLASTSPLSFSPPPSLVSTISSSLHASVLLTPQNTDPFTLLNMRTLTLTLSSSSPGTSSSSSSSSKGSNGFSKVKGPPTEWKVSSKSRKAGKSSQPWWSVWESAMKVYEKEYLVDNDEEDESGSGFENDDEYGGEEERRKRSVRTGRASLAEEMGGGVGVVYGHWAGQGLQVQGHSVGLDSGCVYGRQLSALVFDRSRTTRSVSPLAQSASSQSGSSSTASASTKSTVKAKVGSSRVSSSSKHGGGGGIQRLSKATSADVSASAVSGSTASTENAADLSDDSTSYPPSHSSTTDPSNSVSDLQKELSAEQAQEVEQAQGLKAWWNPWSHKNLKKRSYDDDDDDEEYDEDDDAEGDEKAEVEMELDAEDQDEIEMEEEEQGRDARRLRKRAPPQFRPLGGLAHTKTAALPSTTDSGDDDLSESSSSSASSSSVVATTTIARHHRNNKDNHAYLHTSPTSKSSLTPSTKPTGKLVNSLSSSMKAPSASATSISKDRGGSRKPFGSKVVEASSVESEANEGGSFADAADVELDVLTSSKTTDGPDSIKQSTSQGQDEQDEGEDDDAEFSAKEISFAPLRTPDNKGTGTGSSGPASDSVWIVSVDCKGEVEMDTE
ncbi:hypothetical protein JCM10212_003896 [Sporobolomyces blumeae]